MAHLIEMFCTKQTKILCFFLQFPNRHVLSNISLIVFLNDFFDTQLIVFKQQHFFTVFVCNLGIDYFLNFYQKSAKVRFKMSLFLPTGSKVRKIPFPTGNPFTCLFNAVSCPNYTYEISAWVAFSIMTQCLPAGLFTLAGAYQMTVWALGKHRNYKKEFEKYPRGRRAIIPFII